MRRVSRRAPHVLTELTAADASRLERRIHALLAAGRGLEGWSALIAAAEESPRFIGGYAEGMEFDYSRARADANASRRLLAALSRWIAREPRRAEAWAWRGAMKRKLLDYAGAIRDLDRAWTLGLKLPMILTWRGEAKFQVGRAAEGSKDLRAAVKRGGAGLAICLERTGQAHGGERCLWIERPCARGGG